MRYREWASTTPRPVRSCRTDLLQNGARESQRYPSTRPIRYDGLVGRADGYGPKICFVLELIDTKRTNAVDRQRIRQRNCGLTADQASLLPNTSCTSLARHQRTACVRLQGSAAPGNWIIHETSSSAHRRNSVPIWDVPSHMGHYLRICSSPSEGYASVGPFVCWIYDPVT